MTGGEPVVIKRVTIKKSGISIDGDFELPPLATLTAEEQTFVAAFVRSHGSIKEMERLFGISYPTVKGRIERIAGKLNFVETNPAPSRLEVLEQLRRGEITADAAVRKLKNEEP